MAKRKRNKRGQFTKGGGRTRTRTRTVVKYRTRKNPTKRRRAATYAKRTIAGINLGSAFKNTFPLLLGALCAKFAAKKFADGGGEGDNWTWKNYLLAMAGGFVAAVGASAIFKSRGNISQKVMEGAMLLTAYKVFTNEIAPSNEYLESWFGEDDYLPEMGADIYPSDVMDGYGLGYDEDDEGLPDMGDIYQADDDDYVMGADGYWRPVSEGHRIPAGVDFAGSVQPVDPTMGYAGDVQPVDPTMGGYGNVIDEFNAAYPRVA